MAETTTGGNTAAGPTPAPAATPAAPAVGTPAPVQAPLASVGGAPGAVADPNVSVAAQQNPDPVQPGEEEMVLVNTLPTPDGTPGRAAQYVTRAEAERINAEVAEANAQRLASMPGAGQDANDHV